MLVSKSRRALLHELAIAALAAPVISGSWSTAQLSLHRRFDDDPVVLVRTAVGRKLSAERYHSSEIAFTAIEAGFFAQDLRVTLHQAGAVAKLALCAYLLDIGFPDDWNAKHLRQDIGKALVYANSTGLGHHCPGMERLALILSPYWKWGYPQLIGDPALDDGCFSPSRVRLLLRTLLDRVADGTGHPRPQKPELRQREVRS